MIPIDPSHAMQIEHSYNRIDNRENHVTSPSNPYKIIKHLKHEINKGLNHIKENAKKGIYEDPTKLERASQVLNVLEFEEFSPRIINELRDGNNRFYTFVYDNKKIFTIADVIVENSFTTYNTCRITLEDGFESLYNQYYYNLDYDLIDDDDSIISDNTTATYVVN